MTLLINGRVQLRQEGAKFRRPGKPSAGDVRPGIIWQYRCRTEASGAAFSSKFPEPDLVVSGPRRETLA